MRPFDVIILGAGAAGMMAAIEAGKRGRSVLVVDHATAPGEKIRISGGGRCNFTNINDQPAATASSQQQSALRRLGARAATRPPTSSPWSSATASPSTKRRWASCSATAPASQIVNLLTGEMAQGRRRRCELGDRDRAASRRPTDGFAVQPVDRRPITCAVAGRRHRRQVDPQDGRHRPRLPARRAVRPARHRDAPGAGAADLRAAHARTPGAARGHRRRRHRHRQRQDASSEAMLFTHRGLSGPAILQISSYWREGDAISIDLLPGVDLAEALRARPQRDAQARSCRPCWPRTCPSGWRRCWREEIGLTGHDRRLLRQEVRGGRGRAQALDAQAHRLRRLPHRRSDAGRRRHRRPRFHHHGGAQRARASTSSAKCVDVTGWLGGYNFQWAWASGWAAGQVA